LAEILGANGYSTGAVIGGFVLDSEFGLDQGFDTYNDQFEQAIPSPFGYQRRGAEVSHLAVEWLDIHQAEKFFLFLHYYDPHAEYEPPEPFATEFSDDLYAGEIAYTDFCIARVVRKLKELGLYDSSLIIITSDHGEMLGEHGENTHTYFIYQSAIKVPLIFKIPGKARRRVVEDLTGIVDIVPTVCSLLGIETEAKVHGKDLSAYFAQSRRAKNDRYLYSESVTAAVALRANMLFGVITDRWKYIQTTRPELYDILADPGETTNVILQQPQRARVFQDKLKQILEQTARNDDFSSRKKDFDWKDIRRLQALGYVGGLANSDFEFDESKPDPKDLIDHFKAYQHFILLCYAKRDEEAKILCKELLSKEPQLIETNLFWVVEALEREDYAQAVPCLQNLLDLKYDPFKTHYNLGTSFRHLNKPDRAINHYTEALKIKPDAVKAHDDLADVLANQNKLDEAIRHYGKSLNIDASQYLIYVKLAKVYSKKEQTAQVINCWEKVLELKTDWPSALNNLAWIRATHEEERFRDPARAVELARRAAELTNYQNLSILDTLGVSYAAAGDFAQAIKTAKRALELAKSTGDKDAEAKAQKGLDRFTATEAFEPGYSETDEK
jgi:tetratricopeptide (TPR) repeat protein